MKYLIKLENFTESKIYLKNFEMVQQDTQEHLIDLLRQRIIDDNKTINGFNVYMDDQTGTMEWYDKKIAYTIFATPFYDYYEDNEFNNTQPISTMCNGDDIEDYRVKVEPLIDINDIARYLKFYYKLINNVTSGLLKRIEFKEIVSKILKIKNYSVDINLSINIAKVDDKNNNFRLGYTKKHIQKIIDCGYYGNSEYFILTDIGEIPTIYIKTEDIIKLLDKVKENYPDIIASIKYNL